MYATCFAALKRHPRDHDASSIDILKAWLEVLLWKLLFLNAANVLRELLLPLLTMLPLELVFPNLFANDAPTVLAVDFALTFFAFNSSNFKRDPAISCHWVTSSASRCPVDSKYERKYTISASLTKIEFSVKFRTSIWLPIGKSYKKPNNIVMSVTLIHLLW